jgi:hypothetical protein
LRPRKNDIYVLTERGDGLPYQVWNADLWECPDCGHQVILGYGQSHCSEHYETDFKTWLSMVTHTIKGQLKGLPGERVPRGTGAGT